MPSSYFCRARAASSTARARLKVGEDATLEVGDDGLGPVDLEVVDDDPGAPGRRPARGAAVEAGRSHRSGLRGIHWSSRQVPMRRWKAR